jgi:hypothetical protein
VTFTSVESRWKPLLQALHNLNKGFIDVPNNFNKLDSKDITNLVRADPITCVQYYDHQMVAFRNLCKKDSSIFGVVQYFYYVIEFQNRGSEHDHDMLWIKNAPIYSVHDNHEIVAFVDKYISCDVCLLPKDLQDSQTH